MSTLLASAASNPPPCASLDQRYGRDRQLEVAMPWIQIVYAQARILFELRAVAMDNGASEQREVAAEIEHTRRLRREHRVVDGTCMPVMDMVACELMIPSMKPRNSRSCGLKHGRGCGFIVAQSTPNSASKRGSSCSNCVVWR